MSLILSLHLCAKCRAHFLYNSLFHFHTASPNHRSLNYYERLKVDASASSGEIKSAFLKRSKELHPDKNPQSTKAHEDFVKLNEAFSVLKSPASRRQYDMSIGNYGSSSKGNRTGRTLSQESAGHRGEKMNPFEWASNPEGHYNYQYRDISGKYHNTYYHRMDEQSRPRADRAEVNPNSPAAAHSTWRFVSIGLTLTFILFVWPLWTHLRNNKIDTFRYYHDTTYRRMYSTGESMEYMKMQQARAQAASENREKLSANLKPKKKKQLQKEKRHTIQSNSIVLNNK